MHKLDMVTAAIDYIEAHLAENPDLDAIAAAVHYSKYHLHRVFSGVVGINIHEYTQRRRLTEAAKLLVFSQRSILDIAMAAGYGSQQAFTDVFRAMYKQSPLKFREREAYYALQLEYKFDGSLLPPDGTGTPQRREITFATEEDIPAWMELVRLAIDGFPHLDEAEHLKTLARYLREHSTLILKEDGRALGIMMLCRDTGSIDFLGTHPLYRRQGISQLLLERALEELLEHKSISITTFRAGDRADTGQRRGLCELGFAEAELLVEFGYPTQRMTLEHPGGEGHG